VHDDSDRDDLVLCPICGAESAEPGYNGHGMHCLRYYREEESRGA
jgi:hypothetical protein